MTALEDKITTPFAFIKISANPLAAHCQAAQADTQIQACKRANSPTRPPLMQDDIF